MPRARAAAFDACGRLPDLDADSFRHAPGQAAFISPNVRDGYAARHSGYQVNRSAGPVGYGPGHAATILPDPAALKLALA